MKKSEKDVVKELAKAKWKAGLTLFAAIVVVVLLIGSFYYGRKLGKTETAKLVEEKPQITQDILHQQLEGIGELNTVRYYYTNMGRYENKLEIKGQAIPFTKKTFIISYDGIIKAGVDLSKLVFTLNGKTIRIQIPGAEILSHEVDEDSVVVMDEQNSIFNGLSTEDVTNFQKDQKKAMEERAVANGILTEAKENTKDSLNAIYSVLLKDDEYEEGYTLEFVE